MLEIGRIEKLFVKVENVTAIREAQINIDKEGHPKGSVETAEEGMEKSMSIHALAGLGLRFNLNKSFAFDAGVQYMTSGKSWKMNGSKGIFDYERPVRATTPEEKAKGDKVNLMRQTSGLKNGAFRVTASLIYKF